MGEFRMRMLKPSFRRMILLRFALLAAPCSSAIPPRSTRGTTLESGDRLVLEIEYCSSLFGGPFAPIHIKKDANPRLLELVKSYPNHWSKFILD